MSDWLIEKNSDQKCLKQYLCYIYNCDFNVLKLKYILKNSNNANKLFHSSVNLPFALNVKWIIHESSVTAKWINFESKKIDRNETWLANSSFKNINKHSLVIRANY